MKTYSVNGIKAGKQMLALRNLWQENWKQCFVLFFFSILVVILYCIFPALYPTQCSNTVHLSVFLDGIPSPWKPFSSASILRIGIFTCSSKPSWRANQHGLYYNNVLGGGGVQFLIHTLQNKSICKFGHKVVEFFFFLKKTLET